MKFGIFETASLTNQSKLIEMSQISLANCLDAVERWFGSFLMDSVVPRRFGVHSSLRKEGLGKLDFQDGF